MTSDHLCAAHQEAADDALEAGPEDEAKPVSEEGMVLV